MKNLKIITILLVFVLATISAAASLGTSDIMLGSKSQERGENITSTITISNSGSSDVQNVTVTLAGVDPRYFAGSQLSSTTIPAGGSVTLTISGTVPLNFDAVDSNGNAKAFDIGDIIVKGKDTNGTAESATSNLFMQARSKLTFSSKTQLKINGVVKSISNGKSFSDIRRGDNIDMTVQVANRFGTSGDCLTEGKDCDITDIQGNVQSEDSQLEVDEDLGIDTVNANGVSSDKISFTIPDDADDNDYRMTMWATGRDENGALQGDRWTFRLQVSVPSDEVKISNLQLGQDSLSCTAGEDTLSVTLDNTGLDDQNDASILVESPKLGIDLSAYNLDISSGDTLIKTFNLNLPSKVSPGTYYLQVSGNVNANDETDSQTATLTILPCDQPVTSNNTTTPTNPGNTEVKVVEVPPSSGVIYGTQKPSTTANSSQLAWVLAALFVVAFMLLILIVVVLLKK